MVIKEIFTRKNVIEEPLSIESVVEKISQATNSLSPEGGLRFLLELDNRIYSLLGQASVRYGNGIHTKHRHIKYHDFFISHIRAGESVLDLGCGNGACAYDIAVQVPEAIVTGIDFNHESIISARENYICNNLSFAEGDITKMEYEGNFDVVILSNVLEHIKERIPFLITIKECLHPKHWLIRVPVYERDWRIPLKDELGIDYQLDPTHFIEYRQGELEKELQDAGLKIEEVEYRWGEMWCVVTKLK